MNGLCVAFECCLFCWFHECVSICWAVFKTFLPNNLILFAYFREIIYDRPLWMRKKRVTSTHRQCSVTPEDAIKRELWTLCRFTYTHASTNTLTHTKVHTFVQGHCQTELVKFCIQTIHIHFCTFGHSSVAADWHAFVSFGSFLLCWLFTPFYFWSTWCIVRRD